MLVLSNRLKLGGWAEKSNEEKMQRKWIREISSGIGCVGINACPADTLLSGIRKPLTGSDLLLSRTRGAFLWVSPKKRKKQAGGSGN